MGSASKIGKTAIRKVAGPAGVDDPQALPTRLNKMTKRIKLLNLIVSLLDE
jgi:hypothetical protein